MNCLAQKRKFKNKKPVWTDPDDPAEKDDVVDSDLEERTSKRLHDDTSSTSEDDDDDCDIYASDVRSRKISLETKELKFKHLVHINSQRAFTGVVKQVQFHPKSKVALVTLSKNQVDLFEVDGERNKYIQNIKIPRTNNPFCAFTNDGDSIMIASERYGGTFFVYDMMSSQTKTYPLRIGRKMQSFTDFSVHGQHIACRKEGSSEVLILNSKTYEIESSMKINEAVKVVRFTGDGDIMIAGENAATYIWDLRKTSLCKNRFIDEGTVHITSMDISKNSQQVAIGSDSGMVNIYEYTNCLKDRFPTPIKTFSNLSKDIDLLKYNPSGELLLMSSSTEMKGFRLIHALSGSVYKNFPVPGKRYDHLLSADFSPLGGYMALGCSNGRAQLVRIPYYRSY